MWILGLRLAIAQEEVCSPQPLSRWLEELGAAEHALVEMRLADSVHLLDDAHSVARCVSDVVTVDGMAQYAQLQTLRAFYEQDTFVLETWGLLALSIDPARPWPVPQSHPIHRFLRGIEVIPPEKRAGVFLPPKRGGVFVDGTWLAEPSALPGTYHLVQVFDGDGVRVSARWQDGASFPDELVGDGPAGIAPRWFTGDGGADESERPAWRLARKDKLKAYEGYLRRDPNGEHAAQARRRIDDLIWIGTEKSPTGAREYLVRYPNGRSRGAAEGVLQGAEFKEALDAGTTQALQLFVGKYPNGLYAGAARRQLDERAWVEVLIEGTEQGYARYRVRWPQGAHFEEARIAQDDLSWLAADGQGRKAVEAYLHAWPNGGHSREARAYLDGLTFQTVQVVVGGNGPEESLLQARVVVVEELLLAGFEVVEVSADAIIDIVVDELPVGDLRRWIAKVEVHVPSSVQPLSSQEILLEPRSVRDALMDLDEALRPAVRHLSKFRRKSAQ